MNRYKLTKAGVNPNEGIARFNGDKEMYEKLLYEFREDTYFEQLKEAIASGNVEAAFLAAHSLKGVLGNLSMTRMYEDLYPLVEQLRAGSMEDVEEFMEPVKKDYEDIMTVLSQE